MRDIATLHTGSLLGIFWTFVNPLIMIFILWYVFHYGFKITTRGDVPFILWLTAGMAIWQTFTEVVSGATGVVVANVHLVKKIVFPLSILPVVKLVASLITHTIFIVLLVVLICLHGSPVSVFWFQALYYFFAMSMLALGISWFTSSVNVFVRDTHQIINILLQIGFWATPVFWDPGMMPEKVQPIIKLNPMNYVVQGYRDSFVYFVPFWDRGLQAVYFWAVVGLIFLLGAIVFHRLRPHFADVL